MTQNPEPKSYHHGNLRQSLVDEAVRQLEASGVESLSLRKVAAGVGVSHTAPYRHFRNKDELLAAVAAEGFGALRICMEEAGSRETKAPARLIAIGVAYVTFAVQHPSHFRVMFRLHPEAPEELQRLGQAAFQVMVETIEAGIQANQFREASLETLGLAAWTMVHGQASLLLDGLLRDPQMQQENLCKHAEQQARGILPNLLEGLLR
ncbi:MAG: TetR/AcrR family transcriptional regulator [Planctomycetota bacterium]